MAGSPAEGRSTVEQRPPAEAMSTAQAGSPTDKAAEEKDCDLKTNLSLNHLSRKIGLQSVEIEFKM